MAYPKTERKNPRKAPRPSLRDATYAYILKGEHAHTVCQIVRRSGHSWYALEFHGKGVKMFHASYLRVATVDDVK